MAGFSKLSKKPSLRDAIIRRQVTDLLWFGKIETTEARAKAVQRVAEKLITLAVNTYQDTVKVNKDVVDEKGVKSKKEVMNDGPNKLNARRKIMAGTYDIQEQRLPKESKTAFVGRTEGIYHPLPEKMFNVYAPRYAQRKEETGQGGGYTRIVKKGPRRGDGAESVIITMI